MRFFALCQATGDPRTRNAAESWVALEKQCRDGELRLGVTAFANVGVANMTTLVDQEQSRQKRVR